MIYKTIFKCNLTALALAAASFLPVAARAQSTVPPGVTVDQGWTTATTAPGKSTPAYFTLRNSGLTPDTLVSITCPIAHRTELVGASGKAVGGMPVKPGETLRFTPSGTHLVLQRTRFRFYAHAMIPCSAEFLGAGTMLLYLHVESANAKAYRATGRIPIRN